MLGAAGGAFAQDVPTIPIGQEEFDPQGRSSTVLGSGARALGMGGAFLARADDATAASWNPAGLSYLVRPEVSGVWNYSTFRSTSERSLIGVSDLDKTRGGSPDFASAAYPFRTDTVSGTAQLSFQRVTSFSYERTLSRPPTGAVRGSERTINSSGGLDVAALGFGMRISNQWRLGATVNKWFNGFDLTRENERQTGSAQQLPTTATAQSSFRLNGWNINAGAIWSPRDNISVGLVVKRSVGAGARQRVQRVDLIGAAPDQIRTEQFAASNDVQVKLPGSLGIGVSWRPWNRLTLATDLTKTFWSQANIKNYLFLQVPTLVTDTTGATTIVIAPPQPLARRSYPNLNLAYLSEKDRQTLNPLPDSQVNSRQLRFGAEYVVLAGRSRIPLRGGYFTDKQNFNSPGQPPGPPTFQGYTVGVGYGVGDVIFDAAYVWERGRFPAPDGSDTRIRSKRFLTSMIFRFGETR